MRRMIRPSGRREAGTEAQVFWAKHAVGRTGMFANGLWDADEKLWKAAEFITRINSLPPRVGAELRKKSNGEAGKFVRRREE
jgi:hypothetical protein